MTFATMPPPRSPSPTASIASSRASQRPGLPVKPGHLSVAHTGTATSVAFQQYIRAQVTGSSEVGSRQSAYQQAEADDDEEDGEDEAQWMTIKAAAAAAPVDVEEKRLPLQEVFRQRMNAQATNLATRHGQFASSASTIKGSHGLAAELLLRGDSSQDTNGSPSVSRWLEQTKQAVPSLSPSLGGGIEQDAASSRSGLPTDQGSPDITHSELPFRLGATTLPIALLPDDKVAMPSNALGHHAIERSRDPSIVTDINGSKMAQWDLHTPPKEPTKPSQLNLLRLASTKRTPAPSSPLLVPPSPGPLSNSLPESKPARALFTFKGERAFNELSLLAGQSFQILDEKLQGGWSLAMVEEDGVCCKGLVPQGWYTFERLMAPPPPTDEDAEAGTLAKEKMPLSTHLAPAVAASAPISVQAEQVRNAASSSTMASHSPRPVSIESLPGRAVDSLSQFLSRARPIVDDKPAMVPSPLQSEVDPLTVALPPDAEQQTFDEPTSSLIVEADLADALSAQSDCGDLEAPVVSERIVSAGPPFARTLRRWSPFVACGAEEYLLSQTPERQSTSNAHTELDKRYDIVTGSNGHLQWTAPRQCRWVDVHDPLFIEPSNVKQGWLSRSSTPFVTYQVTIASADSKLSMPTTPYDQTSPPTDLPVQVQTVSRRFKHFVQLSDMLAAQYPLLFAGLPPLPTKSFAKRLDSVFVEQRRRELGNWLERVVRHLVLGEGAATTAFLAAHAVEGRELPTGEEAVFDEWEHFIASSAQQSRSLKSDSFAKTYHPEFAIDLDEVAQEGERFAKWSQRIEGRFRGQDGSSSMRYDEPVLAAIDDLREDLLSSSQCYRGLSGSLTRLVQSDEPSRRRLQSNGCWREDCEECLPLASALQTTSDAFAEIADLYDSQARHHLLPLHERVYNVSRPFAASEALLETHRATIAKYRLAREAEQYHQTAQESRTLEDGAVVLPPTLSLSAAEQLASKAETVLSVTTAEMAQQHTAKVQDWTTIGKSILDEQIALHEEALLALKKARTAFDSEEWLKNSSSHESGPRGLRPHSFVPMHRTSSAPVSTPSELAGMASRAAPPPPLTKPSHALLPPTMMTTAVELASDVMATVLGSGKRSDL